MPIIAGRSFRVAGQQKKRHPLTGVPTFSTRRTVFGTASRHG
jgi:hypothetical protein